MLNILVTQANLPFYGVLSQQSQVCMPGSPMSWVDMTMAAQHGADRDADRSFA